MLGNVKNYDALLWTICSYLELLRITTNYYELFQNYTPVASNSFRMDLLSLADYSVSSFYSSYSKHYPGFSTCHLHTSYLLVLYIYIYMLVVGYQLPGSSPPGNPEEATVTLNNLSSPPLGIIYEFMWIPMNSYDFQWTLKNSYEFFRIPLNS